MLSQRNWTEELLCLSMAELVSVEINHYQEFHIYSGVDQNGLVILFIAYLIIKI